MSIIPIFYLNNIIHQHLADPRIETIEAKVSALETLASHTGASLAGICNVIDGTSTGTDINHCCVNANNNKLYCAETLFGNLLGISTQNGAHMCDSTNAANPCLSD